MKDRYLLLALGRHPLRFAWRVLHRFHTNRGTLLASAIAYHALLSVVPLVILLLVALSHVVETPALLSTLQGYLEHLVPGETELILAQVAQFLSQRRSLSWTMALTLLLFSGAAFAVLENALRVIFAHRHLNNGRHPLHSLLLPYVYVLLLGGGLLVATVLNSALQALATRGDIQLLSWTWSPGSLLVGLLYLVSVGGQVAALTLIYQLMPAGRMPWRHALIGGSAATLLWEAVRSVLVWYDAHLSKVNAIYGSLAGVIIVLMTLYAISLIILIGAQVIAEYEQMEMGRD